MSSALMRPPMMKRSSPTRDWAVTKRPLCTTRLSSLASACWPISVKRLAALSSASWEKVRCTVNRKMAATTTTSAATLASTQFW